MSKIEIINNTKESRNEFHKRGWGSDEIVLTRQQAVELFEALLYRDKALGIDDGEYTHVIYIEEDEGNE